MFFHKNKKVGRKGRRQERKENEERRKTGRKRKAYHLDDKTVQLFSDDMIMYIESPQKNPSKWI